MRYGEQMSDLNEEYTNTNYWVLQEQSFDSLKDFCIRIGAVSAHVDALLEEYALENKTWAYITAWNPYSNRKPLEENKIQNEQLLLELAPYIIRYGYGCSPSYSPTAAQGTKDSWMEESFLVLGITPKEAIALGIEYGQNAIVLGAYQQEAELKWCPEKNMN